MERSASDQPYTVKYFGNDDIESVKKTIDLRMKKLWDCSANANSGLVSHLLLTSGFAIDRVVPQTSAAGKSLLKLEFSITPDPAKAEKSRSNSLRSGWLLVSPEESWVMYSSELRFPSTDGGYLAMTTEVEYEGLDGGIPIPKRVVWRNVGYDPKDKAAEWPGAMSLEEMIELANYRSGPVPDSEFTPAAFGLPELGGPGRGKYRNYTGIWLIGIAVAAFALAIVLRRRASRPKPA